MGPDRTAQGRALFLPFLRGCRRPVLRLHFQHFRNRAQPQPRHPSADGHVDVGNARRAGYECRWWHGRKLVQGEGPEEGAPYPKRKEGRKARACPQEARGKGTRQGASQQAQVDCGAAEEPRQGALGPHGRQPQGTPPCEGRSPLHRVQRNVHRRYLRG